MKTRLISAGVGVVIALGILFLGEVNSIFLNIALGIVTAILCFEFLSAKHLQKDIKFVLPCCCFGLLSAALVCTTFRLLPAVLFFVSIAAILIFNNKSINFDDYIFALFGTILITVLMSLFAYYSCIENKYSAFYAVLVVSVPWLADSGAYFVGTFLGKNKLCPDISPKKTVEGAIGGVLTGILGSVLVGLVFMLIYHDFKPNLLFLILIGFVNSIVSILGDLFFSVIKRHCGIKDYGTIMPGHGGLLDRFDSVLFCIPFTVFVSQFLF